MESISVNFLVWVGIFFCLSQSAMFSGLNLALLGISRLRLEVEAQAGNPDALKILALRKDVNFLLTTILWGNVSINVLLTLLSNSVMAGLTAFLFSTILITFAGEIAPQAYFSRHAMRMGAFLAPVLRFYQLLLYPVAKPSALVLDRWLGEENISYFREQDLHTVIQKHIEANISDVSNMEGVGAMNFLSLDDINVTKLGEEIYSDSIIMLPMEQDMPIFPDFVRDINDSFLQDTNRSGKKWVVIVNESQQPYMAFNVNMFLRDILSTSKLIKPEHYCHRPIIVKDEKALLGSILPKLKVYAVDDTDDVIENDLIIIWTKAKRVITGTDILGYLLRGIVKRETGRLGKME